MAGLGKNICACSDPPRRRLFRAWMFVMLITLGYASAHLTWYARTPMGQFPVLDGGEMLDLARNLAAGEHAHNGAYRAVLYPWVLSRFATPLSSNTELVRLARIINLFFHLGTVTVLFWGAWRFWGSLSAALLASLLYGCNPVALHFAGDPLDTTMAVFFFGAGLVAALETAEAETSAGQTGASATAGLCWAVGTLARPHLLASALTWPLLAAILPGTRRWKKLLAATLPLFAVFLLAGFITQENTGVFHILPTQGGYNLYAANREGADGRFFVQQLDLGEAMSGYANPAQRESDILYQRETGRANDSEAAKDRYWRRKAIHHIVDSPLAWMRLMTWKTYALLNNCEQYNNKTYSIHKQRSPWLRWNPIHWTIILAMAMISLCSRPFNGAKGLSLAAISLIYALGVLLFYASSRFRLPLYVPMSLLAGGLAPAITALSVPSRNRLLVAVLSSVFCLAIGYSRWNGIQSDATIINDYLLLSRSAARAGDDTEALRWARCALKRDSCNRAAMKLAALSEFNLMAQALPNQSPSTGEMEQALETCKLLAGYSEQMAYPAGVYAWRLGQREEAIRVWGQAAQPGSGVESAARAALILVGHDDGRYDLGGTKNPSREELLAWHIRGNPTASSLLLKQYPRELLDATSAQLKHLFNLP